MEQTLFKFENTNCITLVLVGGVGADDSLDSIFPIALIGKGSESITDAWGVPKKEVPRELDRFRFQFQVNVGLPF